MQAKDTVVASVEVDISTGIRPDARDFIRHPGFIFEVIFNQKTIRQLQGTVSESHSIDGSSRNISG
jgi:hypothetical protein